MVLPAGIDMHVHMRDGAQAYKEDWGSGTRSALAGGVTVVVDQPNTVPAITTPAILAERVQMAQQNSFCHFGINAGVTPAADLEGMAEAGALAFGETFAGPSSYAEELSREELSAALKRISSLKGLVTIHAEVVNGGDDTDLLAHDRLRPADGEIAAVEMVRDITPPGSRIHFCHISSADSINEIRKHNAGTIEVTPHHLYLSCESFDKDDPCGKVNPPLRPETVRKKLKASWDRIDVIASDHAPHSCADKKMPFSQAPSGLPGVQTMIPLLMADALAGNLVLSEIIAKTSEKPAEILGIPPAGFSPGMRADFAVYPRKTTPIHADMLSSRAGWTPYEGMDGVFPETVLMSGMVVYEQGEYTRSDPVWFRGRG
jgi:dihydroorotase